MDGVELYQAWLHDCELMKRAVAEATDRGRAAAKAEAEYYAMKATQALLMKAQGTAVGIIDMTIKGDAKVNPLLLNKLTTEAEYKSALKAIDVYRDSTRYLYDQIKAARAGDMNEY